MELEKFVLSSHIVLYHTLLLLGHITRVEIQKNLGNSQKTVVNSGGVLAKVMSAVRRRTVPRECSHVTL